MATTMAIAAGNAKRVSWGGECQVCGNTDEAALIAPIDGKRVCRKAEVCEERQAAAAEANRVAAAVAARKAFLAEQDSVSLAQRLAAPLSADAQARLDAVKSADAARQAKIAANGDAARKRSALSARAYAAAHPRNRHLTRRDATDNAIKAGARTGVGR